MKLILTVVLSLLVYSAHAELNVYSDRPIEKMEVITAAYSAKTGESVNVLTLSASEIKARLIQEGVTGPADVVVVKDLVYLSEISDESLLQPLNSQFAQDNVDSSMQSKNWTAITYRARTLVYNKSYDVSGINTYADLADPKYAKTLCLRTSESSYNQVLVASMVESYGREETAKIVDGWLNNLMSVNDPFFYSSDTEIIMDIAKQGETCSLGITNSYYLGAQLLKNPNLPVGIKFLDLKEGGVSTNGIGAGVSASSQNKPQAVDFINFMLSEEMQKTLSTMNQDFPANKNVVFPENIRQWQGVRLSPLRWDDFANKISVAEELFEELSYL